LQAISSGQDSFAFNSGFAHRCSLAEFGREIDKLFTVDRQRPPEKEERRLTRVLPIVGLEVGAIGVGSLFRFRSGRTLSIWLLVINFIKIFSI
jgi:hypothetical protein